MIRVLAPGPLATVQDQGRFGWASLGVTRAGPFDRSAAARANRLLGQPPGTALVEVTLGGLVIETEQAVALALTGARCPVALGAGGRAVGAPGFDVVFTAPAGARLSLGTPPEGLRTYLAVAGGIVGGWTPETEHRWGPVLGSMSTDTLGGVGPPVLTPGTRLMVGPAPHELIGEVVPDRFVPAGGDLRVPVGPGPRADWVSGAVASLCGCRWTVRPDSDRIAVRLAGPAIARVASRIGAELASEGLISGAVQLPPDGQPLVFGPDHPTTGGYPVIGVVDRSGLDCLAQVRPGQGVRFVPG